MVMEKTESILPTHLKSLRKNPHTSSKKWDFVFAHNFILTKYRVQNYNKILIYTNFSAKNNLSVPKLIYEILSEWDFRNGRPVPLPGG